MSLLFYWYCKLYGAFIAGEGPLLYNVGIPGRKDEKYGGKLWIM